MKTDNIESHELNQEDLKENKKKPVSLKMTF